MQALNQKLECVTDSALSTTEEPSAWMNQAVSLPSNAVPTPTIEYRQNRKLDRVTRQTTMHAPQQAAGGPILIPVPRIPNPRIPNPLPFSSGCRVLIFKQDPTVAEIGIRKAALPGHVLTGPRDARFTSQGLAPVDANALGDFIQTPGTDAFDAVHTFAVVRMTLNMVQRALGGSPAKWQWNSASNADPISVQAHGLPDVMNAFYSRNERALRFGHFIRPGTTPPERVFTCRSLDIVSHECGHAILDGIKPAWIAFGNPPQTGALHESFGDLTAIFLAMSQLDQVEAVIAQTRARLHEKTFLSDLAEQFGLALGRPNGLRNADNDLTLAQVGTEVHDLSQVFTGAIYDVLADIFAFERNWQTKDDAAVLYQSAQYLFSLVLRAIQGAPDNGATFADVANKMLSIANSDGKPVQYRNSIRNRFTLRQVVVSPTPLAVDHDGEELAATTYASEGGTQNRNGCCGTMQHAEYMGGDDLIADEMQELKRACGSKTAGKAPVEVFTEPVTAGRNRNTAPRAGGNGRRPRSTR